MYRSKIDLWLILLAVALCVWPIIDAFQTSNWLPVYVMLPVLLLFGYLMSYIKYIVDKEDLIVVTGPKFRITINILDIKSVTKTYNPLSAPALSLKRLEIKYGDKYDYVLISPKDRERFIKQLLSVNPDIHIKI